jgi:predicted permease
MAMHARVFYGVGLFAGSLLIGLALGRAGLLPQDRAQVLIRTLVKRVTPVVLALLFWRLPLTDVGVWWLPAIGCVASVSTLLPAMAYARWAGLAPAQTGSFVTCALFSNVGYLGAFTLFALFGETAYGLATLYFMSFSPLFYLLGFALARRFGRAAHPPGEAERSDQLRLYPFLGLCAGLALNLLRIPRPAFLEPINQTLITADNACYLIAIGSQLRFEPLRGSWRHGAAMAAIKFLYTPAVAWALASLAGLDGLTRSVALFESAMPVAISPLMLPMLFGVDRRLAQAVWLVTTLAAIPLMVVLVPWLTG